MNCQQKSRFSLFPRAFKNRDPKSSKKSSPGGQNEPQELLRRSQERPKRPQDGPKSRQERPKRRPRAARSAPKGPQARPWAPKVRQEALREAPGAHFGLILGGPGLHFQAIEASFSKLARAPPDNRKHSSKSLVKRSCVGLAGVWGQKTQPRRGIHVFLRTRKTSLFTNPTCLPDVLFDTAKLKNPRFLRGSVLSKPFFAHPWLPEARNHTKMLFEITCQKVLRDSCGTEAHKDHGSVAGFWGRMPHWRSGHRASKRSCLAVAERVGEC